MSDVNIKLWAEYRQVVEATNEQIMADWQKGRYRKRRADERRKKKELDNWLALPWFRRLLTPKPGSARELRWSYITRPPVIFPVLRSVSVEGYYDWLAERGEVGDE